MASSDNPFSPNYSGSGRVPYFGPSGQQGQTGRTPYLGPAGGAQAQTGRTPYFGPSSDNPFSANYRPAAKGGGGLLGALEGAGHWVASKAGLAAHDLRVLPVGLAEQGIAAGVGLKNAATQPMSGATKQEWADLLTGHPIRSIQDAQKPGAGDAAAAQQVAGLAKGSAEALQHPLRDPFATLVTALPLAHGLGRVAAPVAGVDLSAPRMLSQGEASVPLKASGNAGIRVAQAAHDALVQRALNEKPAGRVAGYGASRMGGSLAETGRYQQRLQAVPAQMLQHAAKGAAKEVGSKTLAQAALRLTSENSTPEEAALFHEAQAAKGVGAAANAKLAAMYRQMHERGLLTVDGNGNVAVDAAKFPKLAEADRLLAEGQAHVDQIIGDYGLMSPEGMQARRDLPGQIRRAGISDPVTTTSGPLSGQSEAALRTRLAALDRQHSKLVDAVAAREKVASLRGVAAAQNRLSARVRAGNVSPTDELRAYAENKLAATMAAYPNDPTVQAVQAALHEADAIRGELSARSDAALGMGGHAYEPAPTNRERGIYGPQGRGYVPYRLTEQRAPQTAVAASAGPVVGKVRPFVGAHEFTGSGLEQGLVPPNTTGLTARNMLRAFRFLNTDQFRRAVLRTGSDVRRSNRDVLVRVPDQAAKPISPSVEAVLGRKTVTMDELHGHQTALSAILDQMIPGRVDQFATDKATPLGVPADPGYRWVDRRALGDLGTFRPRPRGKIAKSADAVNSAVTSATVYFKLGHVGTRVLTNAATNLIQGSLAPHELAKSVRLWRQISWPDRMRALAAAGQHGFEAMPHEGEGFTGRVAGAGARWWAKHADSPFRFNGLAFEARKAGITTPAQFAGFLHDLEHPESLSPAQAARIDAIAKEANRAGIAYDRLSPFERNYLTRAVWFYPWTAASSRFAGWVFGEHPFKGAVSGLGAVQARNQQQQTLGDLPSYEQGLLGLTGGANPLVTDFSTFSPFATAADVLDVVAGKTPAADFANPALAAAGGVAYKLGPFGGSSTQPIADSVATLLGPTWPYQLLEAYRQRAADQSKRMFQKTPLSALERSLVGPAMPRRINLAAAAAAAKREGSGR